MNIISKILKGNCFQTMILYPGSLKLWRQMKEIFRFAKTQKILLYEPYFNGGKKVQGKGSMRSRTQSQQDGLAGARKDEIRKCIEVEGL